MTPRADSRSLTPVGRLWLAVLLTVLTVGVLKNINLLALLGYVLLAVLLLCRLLVGVRLGKLEARRHLPALVFAGTTTRLEVRVRNAGSRAVRGAEIHDAGSDHAASWYFDHVAGHDRHVLTEEVVLPRRGWYALTPLEASTAFPFGLVRREVRIGPEEKLLVLPRVGKLSRDRLRRFLRGADPQAERVHRTGTRHESAQADFHGLRPFRAGDSPRRVHWRTSARRGELMVREFEDVPGDDLLLVVDTAAEAGDDFEAMISLAATLVVEWCRKRGDRLVLAVAGDVIDGPCGADHARQCLEALAGVLPSRQVATPDLNPPRGSAFVVVGVGGGTSSGNSARSATRLDVRERAGWSFYTPPEE